MHRDSGLYKIISTCKERIMHSWHELVGCKGLFMKKTISLLAVAFLSVSCATTSLKTSPPETNSVGSGRC